MIKDSFFFNGVTLAVLWGSGATASDAWSLVLRITRILKILEFKVFYFWFPAADSEYHAKFSLEPLSVFIHIMSVFNSIP